MTRRSAPRLAALAVAVLAGASCSVEQTLPPPHCDREGSGLIVAQSVPDAELVPCVRRLPAGWEVDGVRIDDGGTRVRFDSDRAGDDAAVLHFTRSCELGDAVAIPSDQPGADRLEDIERLTPGFRADRYYTFDGGCVRWRFDFDDGAPAGLAVELGGALLLLSRDDVNEILRETFIDEEL
ncbi:MAG: hypothetical protein AAFZ07_00620 [Actinomycetota bacterium]